MPHQLIGCFTENSLFFVMRNADLFLLFFRMVAVLVLVMCLKPLVRFCFLSSFENLIFSLFLALYRPVIIAQWFIFIREHQRFSLLGVGFEAYCQVV